MNSVELRQQRAHLIDEARAIVAAAETENRGLSAEEQEQYDRHFAAAEDLNSRITNQERLEATPQSDPERRLFDLNRDRNTDPKDEQDARERSDRAYADAFRQYITAERREFIPVEAHAAIHAKIVEMRAQGVEVATAGGLWVPNEMMRSIEKAELHYGGMRQSGAEIITTETGGDLPWPTYNDTTNTGRLLGAESTAFTETDVAIAIKYMKAHVYSSDEVLVTQQFLTDVPVRAEAWLADVLGERIGRITNTHFTSYGAPNGPQGLITATTLGVTAAGATSVTADEIMDLVYTVDKAYRTGARFMFRDAVIREIRQLKDGEGRYLFAPGLSSTEPDTLFGYPVVINNDMPAMTTGLRPIAFGNFHHYKIRDVWGFTLKRLDEIRARNLEVVFLGFSRHDGALIDAGGNPVKHILMA